MEEGKKKKGCNGTIYLVSPSMAVTVSGYQLSRILVKADSLPYPFNSSLFAIGIAHTVAKSKGEAGDVFNRDRNILLKGSGDRHIQDSHTRLVGPRSMLHPYQTRLIILKQTREAAKDQGSLIHCLFDHENVCFVDPEGKCLYVSRAQIMVPWVGHITLHNFWPRLREAGP